MLQIVTAGSGTVLGPGLRTVITMCVCWVIRCADGNDVAGTSTVNRPAGSLALSGLPPHAPSSRAVASPATTAELTLLLLKAAEHTTGSRAKRRFPLGGCPAARVGFPRSAAMRPNT